MNIQTILEFLEQSIPCAEAEEWDNVGLLVGSADGQTDAVVTTLDITHRAIDTAKAVGARLIVSHHPVIFQPLSALEAGSVPYRLAAEGITAYALHTNLDKACGGINDTLATTIGLVDVTPALNGLCRIGILPQPRSAEQLAHILSERLGTAVRMHDAGRPLQRVGVCGGAGGDEWQSLQEQIDAFITGEVKHHEWLEAVQAGITLMDAGHHGTEQAAADILQTLLSRQFPDLSVTAHHDSAPYITLDSSK